MAFREKATSLAVVVLTVVALAAHRLGYASNGLAERVLTGLAVMGLLWTAGRQLSAGRQLGLSDVRAK